MTGAGPLLREIRKASGLTQRQMGSKLGVGRFTVSRWETGISPILLGTFLAFCEEADGDAVRAVARLKMQRKKERHE